MAIPDFHNDTFVAFCDICGFKNKMASNSARAVKSLGKFYQFTYLALQKTREDGNSQIYGLIVSDCAILVAENRNGISNQTALKSLLSCIKEINKNGLEHDLMLTTSIAYGPFHYEQRSEFFGVEKNMVTGAAYIEVFKNQSAGIPKLKCGECRLIPSNLPQEITELIEGDSKQGVFRMIIKEKQHFYFYWMRNRPDEISAFAEAYENTENLKYLGIRLLLQGSRDIQIRRES